MNEVWGWGYLRPTNVRFHGSDTPDPEPTGLMQIADPALNGIVTVPVRVAQENGFFVAQAGLYMCNAKDGPWASEQIRLHGTDEADAVQKLRHHLLEMRRKLCPTGTDAVPVGAELDKALAEFLTERLHDRFNSEGESDPDGAIIRGTGERPRFQAVRVDDLGCWTRGYEAEAAWTRYAPSTDPAWIPALIEECGDVWGHLSIDIDTDCFSPPPVYASTSGNGWSAFVGGPRNARSGWGDTISEALCRLILSRPFLDRAAQIWTTETEEGRATYAAWRADVEAREASLSDVFKAM